MTGIPAPGVGRITVVLLAVVSGVLTYPWQSTNDRWALGGAAAVAMVALLWWRGRYLTTIVGLRLQVLLHRKPIHVTPADLRVSGADAVTTVLVRVDNRDRELPHGLLAGYLDRYGLQCDSVRVTTHTARAGATTWIGLTFSAARNLSALQGRSAQIPLRDAAENAARRLIGHLREMGWTAALADPNQLPELVAADARERWRSVTDQRGHLTAYVATTPEALAAVSDGATESWTVVEIAGTSSLDRVRAGAAIRTEDRPAAALPGLVLVAGRQASALAALHPLSGARVVN